MKAIIFGIRSIFSRENILPKAASLALSVILWAVISGTKSSEIKLRIPVVIKNLPADMTVSEMPDRNVLIVLEGRRDNFKNISAKNITAVVNLENPKVGKLAAYPVDMIKSDIPISIRVELLNKEVKVRVERVISKTVKVVPVVSGKVKEGKIIGHIRVTPEFVTVRGSRSAVEKLTEAKTEQIDVENRGEDLMRDAEIEKDSRNEIYYSESNIKVFIPIFDVSNYFELSLPVALRGTRKNYDYSLEQATVKVALKSMKRKLTEGDVTAYVDFSNMNIPPEIKRESPVTMEVPVIIRFRGSADGIEIISTAPEKFRVKITAR